MTTVKLTARQAEAVLWALDDMSFYWGEGGDMADEGLGPQPIPMLGGGTLALNGAPDIVLSDLKYRLVVQLPDMASDECEGLVWSNATRPALNAWDKIVEAIGYDVQAK